VKLSDLQSLPPSSGNFQAANVFSADGEETDWKQPELSREQVEVNLQPGGVNLQPGRMSLQPTEVLPQPPPSNPAVQRVPVLDAERPISAVTASISDPSGRM